MSEVVIHAEALGKKYIIGHQTSRERYVSLRDVVMQSTKNFLHRTGELVRGRPVTEGDETEEFWALRALSFEILRGEVVGVIGRNGAGKSTLLKILARITEPSEGRVSLRGRVASLLEVGTGFHPELTGRENIFLNGSILGMSRSEIRRKFDEIVAFSEVEAFLDTPVKRYSSGMYVRLAFAVAAHLEPEILIVDEVLAVGDASFQKRCLGKISQVARGGRTVIFVSHNMSAVQSLCGEAFLLDHGTLVEKGPVNKVIERYLSSITGTSTFQEDIPVGRCLRLKQLGFAEGGVISGDSSTFKLDFNSSQTTRLREASILIYSEYGVRVAIIDLRHLGLQNREISEPGLVIEGHIKSLPLVEGDYRIGLWVVTTEESLELLDLRKFSVLPRSSGEVRDVYPPVHRGCIELDFCGEIHQVDDASARQ